MKDTTLKSINVMCGEKLKETNTCVDETVSKLLTESCSNGKIEAILPLL